MKKTPTPKTAFWKVYTDAPDSAVVVEAATAKEAVAHVASVSFHVEPYPTDKLVAYIKQGGEPIKVPTKPKRAYARKAKPATAPAAPILQAA